MNNLNYILEVKNKIENISLVDDYRNKEFAKNFNSHLLQLIDTSLSLSENENTVLKESGMIFTPSIYWQAEGYILENLDDVTDPQVLNELDNLEDLLYDKIIESLGTFYNGSSSLNKIIDNTVHNVLLGIKFNYFSRRDNFSNPWEDSKNILFENSVLHSFSTNLEEISELVKVNNNALESESVRFKKIGVLGKGSRENYTCGFIRDLFGLRNTVVDILDEKSSRGDNPIKTEIIINELRAMGVQDLSDSNIKNWIIGPLKKINKIGSNKEGFFLLNDCNDIASSYYSHLENLKGYYRTLENHRKLANKIGCNNDFFDTHRKLFGTNNELINGDE